MEKKWASAGPWQDDQNFLCIATFLPLRSWRFFIPFLRLSLQVERQIRQNPGLVHYGLKTRLPRLHFWTLSVWMDRAEVNTFVDSEPHATAVKRFEQWAGEGAAFVEWETSKQDYSWTTALKKLKNPTFYYRNPS